MVRKLRQKHGARRAFTLIEMLVVLAIIGVILALGIPAVTTLMKSGGLSAAVREVSNTLSLARQYAITERTYTRVMFPYDQSGTSVSNSMWYQAYTVIWSNRALTGSQSWQYFGKWESLPLSTTFLNHAPGGSFGGGYNLNDNLPSASIPYPNSTSGNNGTFAYFEFSPTGAATQSGSLTISEGISQNGTSLRTSSNYANIFVDNIIGHIRIVRP